ncbi:aromatic amino acid lyase [Halomonas sp. McH1-25]|uniref:aromatic amino acid lyase n=1 Tax=unclassified Halomonas TaxID=2609666 RepID=UPI0031B82B37
MIHLEIQPGQMTLAQARQVFQEPVSVSLSASADANIAKSVDCVNRVIAENRTVYGINTGFGLLAQTRIANEDLEALQRSLVLSHATGVGEAMDDDLVRLIMVLKVNSLARGFSGIRREVLDALITLINTEIYPHIPLKQAVSKHSLDWHTAHQAS